MEPQLQDIDDYKHPLSRKKMLTIGVSIMVLIIFEELSVFVINHYLH